MNDRWPIASIISFLDVIACAFGAIVLLVLILPVGENDGRGESYSLTVVDELTRKITNLTERVRERQLEFASLQAMIDEKSRSSDVRVSEDNVQSMISAIESQLSLKRERVLKERGLLKDQAFNSIVEEKGLPSHLYGIPVDSDHLVLVVDTSGSMKMIWPRVNRVIRDVLTNYPELIGFQIVSDQGEFLVQSDQRWLLPRDWQIQSALEKLESWNAYSNSSPVEGIEVAVSTLFSPGINMALFVVGDDYTGTDFDSFLSKIDQIALRLGNKGQLRIHSLGFYNDQYSQHPERFTRLMQVLTFNHGGALLYIGNERSETANISLGRRIIPVAD